MDSKMLIHLWLYNTYGLCTNVIFLEELVSYIAIG